LYAGGQPILHVSEGKVPANPAGVLDHLAFSATDLKGTVARLKASGIKFTLRRQVGVGTWQIFCHDPCGAKVELDFSPEESAPPRRPRSTISSAAATADSPSSSSWLSRAGPRGSSSPRTAPSSGRA